MGTMGTEPKRSTRRVAAFAALLVATLVASLLGAVALAGPASAADWTVSLKLTKTDGKKLTLRADANRSLSQSGYTLAIWDTTTGARLASCGNAPNQCQSNVWVSATTVPTASTTDLSSVAHSYVATIAEDSASISYPPAGVAVASDPVAADPWTVQLTSVVQQSKQVQLTAWTNYSIPGSGYTLAIFDKTTGTLLKSCSAGDSACEGSPTIGNYYTRASVIPKGATTDVSSIGHEYVAILAGIYDTLPGDNLAATSPVVTSDPWKVSVSTSRSTGQQVQVTAVTNYNISGSGYSLAIWDKTTGKLVKSCSSSDNTCSGSGSLGFYWTRSNPFSPRGDTTELSSVPHEYEAIVAGDVSTEAGDNVAATTATTATSPIWSANLSVTPTTDGRSYSLTAASGVYSLTGSGYTLGIYDQTTGERLAVCGAGYSVCSGNGTVSNYWLRVTGRTAGWSDTYVAVISDDSATLPAANVAATSGTVVPAGA